MPPAYVKAYVKRGKTDAADAEAIAETVTRPTMRFVAVKSKAQQAALMLHKTRDLMVRQRTMLINALRGRLGEYGIIAAKGAKGAQTALRAIHLERDQLPELARAALHGLARQLEALEREIERLEARIVAWHRDDETSRRLATIPGIGPITASAIAASAPDPSLFRSGRQFAAWLGLTPRAHSSGGKERQVGDQQDGRRLPPAAARGRRNGRAPHGPPTRRQCLGHGIAGTEKAEARSGRPGQQDRPHCLGADVSEGELHAGDRLGDRLRRPKTAEPQTREW
jgi:transposase